jgi:tetratricopeptide (TPR) repeat protein
VWPGVLLACTVALPFAIAATARTSAPAAPEPASVGALPTGGTPTDLATQIDHVPILVTALPDVASRDAVAAYRRAGILDVDAVRAAYLATWGALQVPPDGRAALDQLGAEILDPVSPGALPEGADATLATLVVDPDNGARLTNAATMLFGYGALLDSGIAPRSDDEYADGWATEERAVLLLEAVNRRFGYSRAQALNAALFRSVSQVDGGIARAVEPAAAAVEADPTDVTARWVLANLQARQLEDGNAYEAAVETVRPLRADSDSRLLGEVATGDVYLAAAAVRSAEAPRTAAVLARRAVHHYDGVLEEVADAGVYAGRARALTLLGDDTAALTAMEEAVRLAPDSVGLRLELGLLQQSTGDIDAMRETGLDTLEMTGESWSPALAGARYVYSLEPSGSGFAHYGDLGMFGQSVGSTSDRVSVIRTPQGGGFEAGVEVVPTIIDPWRDAWQRGGFAPDVAVRLAVDASMQRGDTAGVDEAIAIWAAQDIVTSQRLVDDTRRQLEHAGWAAMLVAGDGMPPAAEDDFRETSVLHVAEAALRRSGDLERLEALCREVLDDQHDSPGGDLFAEAWRCVGDALVLQGHHEDAVAAFEELAAERDPFIPAPVLLRWGAARLALDAGDEEGRAFLQQAAVHGGADGATALARLGVDDLDQGAVPVALSHFDLALALLNPDDVDSSDQVAVADMRAARALALTNRGVARLRVAQVDPTRPPECDSDADGDQCEAAISDLTAALSVDPLNSVTLMNLAWAERALGREGPARDALAAAVAADASTFPAANDLGVLEARDGRTGAAREAFRAAVAAEPDYALGWWNVGVLELRAGPTHFRSGHAALARAVGLDPSLAGAALDYRFDETVYRASFGKLEEVSSDWPIGRAYGLAAGVLGGVGLITALGRFWGSAVASLWDSVLAFAGKAPRPRSPRFRRLARRVSALPKRLPAVFRPWVPWIVAGVALGVVSIWTVWAREPGTVLAGLMGVAIATASALAAHEGGHLLALRRRPGRLVPAQWTGGVVLAFLLLPFQVSSGPYLAERVVDADEDDLVRIHTAGPVANLGLAALAYVSFLVHPVALLLLTSQISVGVAAYTLLPNVPLDGKPLAERPAIAAVLGALVTGAGVAFAVNAG